MGPRAKRFLLERGGLLALAALGLYAWSAPPDIVENDNAEFSTLGAVGGGAHPSGYPLYVLWLRAWSWLPGQTAAHTASLATALLGALAILVVHAACRAWGARPFAAALATGTLAAAPLVARYHSTAEVFALNHLVVATVLWLSAAAPPLRGHRRALALGLVAGLGLANHLTCAIVAPIGLLGVARAVREADRRALLVAAAGLVVGLLPYAYLFVAPENLLAWPRPESLGELADIFLRRAYGGAFSFSGAGATVDTAAQLAELARSVGRSWLYLLPLVGLGALALQLARPREGDAPRVAWALYALTLLLAGPVLASRFDTPTDWYGLAVVRRFHLLPIVLLAIPVAVGLDRVAARAGRTPPAWLGAVVFAVLAVATVPYLDRAHSPALDRSVRNTLATLPPDAVILGVPNELDVGTRYLQLTEGVRPDVTFVRWASLTVPWYRARFEPLGITWRRVPGEEPQVTLVRDLLARGRPVFVNPGEVSILGAFPNHRHGTLVRVLPPGTPISLDAVVQENRALFRRFDLAYPRPSAGDEFAASVHQRYASTWTRLATLLAREGKPAEAQAALDVAAQLAPLED